jgi:hypothetical protein
MAVFGQGKEIELLKEVYEQRLSDLKERITSLEKENERLLEAVMAVQSPAAYNEMRADKIEMRATEEETEQYTEEARKAELRQRLTEQYLDGMEKPLWANGEQFEEQMNKWLGNSMEDMPVVPPPLHSNDES